MSAPVAEPAYVNGFCDGADLVLLYRNAAGEMLSRRRKAEWSSFYRRSSVTPDVLRDLRNSSFIVGVSEEGEWLRVKWQAPEWRRKAHEPDGWADKTSLEAFEADVSAEARFFQETGAEVAKPRRVYLDIETDSRVPPAVARQGKARVLCWTLVDEEERVVAQGLLERDEDDDEKRVLEEFWRAIDPYDQVVAWYGDGFDFPIVKLRTTLLGARAKDARRWLWLDFLPVYERMNRNAADSGTEKESMRLQDVAMSRLGEGKNEFDASKTYEEWAAGGARRRALVDYCAQDTRLLPRLNRKTGFLDVNDAICAVGRLFANTESANPTNYVDGFLLRMGVERGTRFPSRGAYGREEQEKHEQFAGAFVMKDHKCRGIERDIHVADFSGMYPSIILTWNMSPETKVPVPVNGPIPAGTCRAPSTRCGFTVGAEGILVEALKRIKKMRSFWQKKQAALPPGTPEWVEAGRLSTAYKVIANSFYGVVGSPFSRFFDRQIAESVTQNGVWLIRNTIHAAEQRGMEVVYGDSVTADRIVVARSPEGAVELLPARELWDRSMGVVAERGKEFGQLPGWRALTEKGWRPISAIVRHRAGKQTWRITTKHGQTQVTEDHGIMSGGEQVPPSEFVESKCLFTTVAAPQEVPEERVDLFECVKDAVFHTASRTREIDRRFVLDEDGETFYLDGWGDPGKQLRVKRWYVAGSEEFRALLRLVGIYVGDGSASVRGVTTDARSVLSFCKSCLPTIEQVARDLRVIAPAVDLWGPAWSETVYIVRTGTVTMAFLFHVLCGSKSRGKKLPPFAFKLRTEDRQVLIGAFAQADGPLDQSGEMKYTTNSAKLAAGVSYVLSQHGRAHGWSFRESKGAWTLRTRTRGERVNRYSIKSEVFPGGDEYVYDLTVDGAHTFVDGIGRVLLHNTDSIFVRNTTREAFAEFVAWCNRELYPPAVAECGCVENFIEIAYEKEFARLVMVSAKKYGATYAHYKWTASCACDTAKGEPGALDVRTMTCRDCGKKWEDLPPPRGKPEIRGLEYKRGDFIRIARRLQLLVVEKLMKELCEDPRAFVPMVEAVRDHVLSAPLPVEDVRLSKSLSKSLREYKPRAKTDGTAAAEPAHVQVARVLKARGEQVGDGARIFYYVTDASASPMKVAPASDYANDCDRFYLWENLIYPATQRVLEAAFPGEKGMTTEELQARDWRRFENVRPKKPRGHKVLEQAAERNPGSARPRKPAPAGQGGLFEGPAALPAPPPASPAVGASARPGEPFLITIEARGRKEMPELERVKAVLLRHAGDRPVILRIVMAEGAADLDLPQRVAVSTDLIREIEQAKIAAA